jgi:hypothetical protein
MAYETRLQKACAVVEAAQEAASRAQVAYRKGASCDAVTRADRRLADAWSSWREVSGGVIPDDR